MDREPFSGGREDEVVRAEERRPSLLRRVWRRGLSERQQVVLFLALFLPMTLAIVVLPADSGIRETLSIGSQYGIVGDLIALAAMVPIVVALNLFVGAVRSVGDRMQ